MNWTYLIINLNDGTVFETNSSQDFAYFKGDPDYTIVSIGGNGITEFLELHGEWCSVPALPIEDDENTEEDEDN